MNKKPLAFIDLDDTIFQTNRRIAPDDTFRVGSLNSKGEPLSFLTKKQQGFVDWLFAHADVVPVTARPIDGLQRVQLKFEHGAICSFGGTILDSKHQLDNEWHEIQKERLKGLQPLIQSMPDALKEYAQDLGDVRSWTVEENGLQLYSYVKQNQPQIGQMFLNQIVENIPQNIKDNFYMHLNGNNLAVIPKVLTKQNAVEYYLQKHDPESERFILGYGDSLSDFGFLSNCDWFGTPKNSQIRHFTETKLEADYAVKGYFGHD